MICAVIYEVLQHLPERLRLRRAGHRFVMNHPVQILGLQRCDVGEQIAFNLGPTRADSGKIRKFSAGRIAVGTMAFPTFEPEPFDEHEVRQRVADRRKATTQVLDELGVGESVAGVQSTAIGPSIEIVEESEISQVKGVWFRGLIFFSCWPW